MTKEQKEELLLDLWSYIDLAEKEHHKKTERKAFYWRSIGMKNALQILEIKIPEDLEERLKNIEEELKV